MAEAVERAGSSVLAGALAVVGAAAHLVMGFLILVSGLAAPLWAVALLLAIWIALAMAGIRWWRRTAWLALAPPLLALAIWVATLALGDALLGWTA